MSVVAMTKRERGLTLIELVCVIVALGVLVSVAIRFHSELRYQARVAVMHQLGTTMAANMETAVRLYVVRGEGSTLTVNGTTISVAPPGTVDGGQPIPAGSPTGPAMFVLMGCGPTEPPDNAESLPCAALPGYLAFVQRYLLELQPIRKPGTLGQTCWVNYWPGYISSVSSNAKEGVRRGYAYYLPADEEPLFTPGWDWCR